MASFQRVYLSGSYLLFVHMPEKWVDSESSALYVCPLNTLPLFFQVSRGVGFLQFPELLLDISAFRASCGWGKDWEDNLLDIFKIKISHILDSSETWLWLCSWLKSVVRYTLWTCSQSLYSDIQQCQWDTSWGKLKYMNAFSFRSLEPQMRTERRYFIKVQSSFGL